MYDKKIKIAFSAIMIMFVTAFSTSCKKKSQKSCEHNLSKIDAKPASCVESGNEEYYICQSCNKIYSDSNATNELSQAPTIQALGHTLTKVDAHSATCTQNGNSEYYICSRCNKMFSDEGATNEISSIPVISATGHSIVKVNAQSETCSVDGNEEYYTCSNCHKLYSDNEGQHEIDSIPTVKAKHIYNEQNVCSRCGYVNRPLAKDISELRGIIDGIQMSKDNFVYPTTITQVTPTSDATNITTAGAYQFEGNYGKLVISKNLGDVILILENAHITTVDDSAISVEKGTNLIIYNVKDSVNNITNNKDTSTKDYNCIAAKGDLKIYGLGKLVVTSTSKTGINVSNGLVINDSTVEVNAVNHGISANYAKMIDCKIKVIVDNKDGINVEAKDSSFSTVEGYVYFDNVNYECQTSGDAIQADTFTYIINSTLNITTIGEYVIKSDENKTLYGLDDDDFAYTKDGDIYTKNPSDTLWQDKTYYALKQSCKGIKCGGIKDDNDLIVEGNYFVYIKSSIITMNSFDDCINCKAGNIIIDSGTFNLTSSDDGISSDHNTIIYDGEYQINTYEGIEGEFVEIYDGEFTIVTIDDSINASTKTAGIIPHIIISGGKFDITAGATGDAIDANGRILINGGEIYIKTLSQEVLDSDRGTWIDGGMLISFGGMQIPQRVYRDDQLLPIILLNKSTTAGTKIKIACNDTELLDMITEINSNVIMFFHNNINIGDTVSIYLNDELYKTITIDSVFINK